MFARYRVVARLIPEAELALKRLMNATGMSQTDAVNVAVQVAAEVDRIQRDGGRIHVVEGDGSVYTFTVSAGGDGA